jgi:DNA polymerase-3 subunit chi
MTRIDFYVLSSDTAQERRVLACKLAEKAWRQGMKVHIHTSSAAETELMDKLLWTFRQGSFIPHEKTTASDREREDIQVLIGHDGPVADFDGLLINLALEMPPALTQFQRAAELVDADATVRAEGRKRYAAYKQSGHELTTHTL